jgi:hypothetical protein
MRTTPVLRVSKSADHFRGGAASTVERRDAAASPEPMVAHEPIRRACIGSVACRWRGSRSASGDWLVAWLALFLIDKLSESLNDDGKASS